VLTLFDLTARAGLKLRRDAIDLLWQPTVTLALEERMKAGPLWVESSAVFTTETGERVLPETASLLMRKIIRDYNEPAMPGRGDKHTPLPPPDEPLTLIRLHDLRHVQTTTLLLAGVPSASRQTGVATRTRGRRCASRRSCSKSRRPAPPTCSHPRVPAAVKEAVSS
jgi:hypothetical protein